MFDQKGQHRGAMRAVDLRFPISDLRNAIRHSLNRPPCLVHPGASSRLWTVDTSDAGLLSVAVRKDKNFYNYIENALTFNARQMPLNPAFSLQFAHHAISPLTHCHSALCIISSDESPLHLIQKSTLVSRCPSMARNPIQTKSRVKNLPFFSGHFEGKSLGNQGKMGQKTPHFYPNYRATIDVFFPRQFVKENQNTATLDSLVAPKPSDEGRSLHRSAGEDRLRARNQRPPTKATSIHHPPSPIRHQWAIASRLVFRQTFFNLPHKQMNAVRRAVIDVGTNSVKLLVADVHGQTVQPLHEESRQTRLGKNFYDTHHLQADAIAQTARAVADFAKTAREKNAASVRVIATSAARDAQNAHDLVSAIQTASGLKLEIISGEQEAEWGFQGVTCGTELAKTPLLLMDVGGGSSEFILGHGGHQSFARSFAIGTVRLMEKFPTNDPPLPGDLAKCTDWIEQFLQREIRPALDPVLLREKKTGPVQLAGTGGTATLLALMELKSSRFDRQQIEAAHLTFEKIQAHVKNLWSLPLAQRREIPGLPKSRADVILTGVLIYESVMREFGFAELRVSTRGLRFAALMDQTL